MTSNALKATLGYVSSGAYAVDVHKNLRSGSIYGSAVTLDELMHALREMARSAEKLDALKKVLFYGKDAETREIRLNEGTAAHARMGEVLASSGIDIDLFHGLLGYLTEAGELAEALVTAIQMRKPLDLVNLREEIGDGLWYAEVMCRAGGFSLEDCANTNTAKLRKRYPEKFTEDAALNRNLKEEREVLESDSPAPLSDEAGRLARSIIDGDSREETFASGCDTDA